MLISIFGCEQNLYEYISDTERFNKKTGETEVLRYDGNWMELSQIKKMQKEEREERKRKEKEEYDRTHQEIPSSVLEILQNNSPVSYHSTSTGRLSVHLINNTRWTITELTVEVRIYGKKGKLDTRLITYDDFTIHQGMKKRLLQKSWKALGLLTENNTWNYSFKSAKGYKH